MEELLELALEVEAPEVAVGWVVSLAVTRMVEV